MFLDRILDFDKYDHALRRGMLYWIKWNLMIEERAVYTYRVENINNELHNICHLIKRPEVLLNRDKMEKQKKDENSKKTLRTYRLYELKDLYKVDKTLTKMIVFLALKYGYKKEDL